MLDINHNKITGTHPSAIISVHHKTFVLNQHFKINRLRVTGLYLSPSPAAEASPARTARRSARTSKSSRSILPSPAPVVRPVLPVKQEYPTLAVTEASPARPEHPYSQVKQEYPTALPPPPLPLPRSPPRSPHSRAPVNPSSSLFAAAASKVAARPIQGRCRRSQGCCRRSQGLC
ncbi:hypothetical protein BJ508DRAFT_331456 [Ascobolus immersus RN42]|uniref:Uncharacterized protein n=1 Tax=Ascobolus immersus RN42 TaxID=1160509 RepID=A0A3N4HS87_ASCIM|nr:hypothetical protein BJ508DRAFT_331456 [Ascobolus immersus RN42]